MIRLTDEDKLQPNLEQEAVIEEWEYIRWNGDVAAALMQRGPTALGYKDSLLLSRMRHSLVRAISQGNQ